MEDAPPELSLVIPLFNEAENLPVLLTEVLAALETTPKSAEILLIDDASTDSTPERLRELTKTDPRIHAFTLLRNTRKGGALALGFALARGDIIVTLDGDLQDDPAQIPLLLAEMANGADVVIGWRVHRSDALRKRMLSRLMNLFAALLFTRNLHDMNSGFKAIRRDVAALLPLHGSLYRYVPHFLAAKGYRVREIPVTHRPRLHGGSKFTIPHRLRGILDLISVYSIARFADRPLHLFGTLGGVVCLLGVLLGAHLTRLWFLGQSIGGRPLLLLTALLLLIGVQIIAIGIIGELLVSNASLGRVPGYRKL